MAIGIIESIKNLFEGDPAVRRVADDPVLTAELLLLFRMILADGQVDKNELASFKRICRESFGMTEGSLNGVVKYLQEFGYETTGTQALRTFSELDEERKNVLVKHLLQIAKADNELHSQEVRLLRRTIEVLGLEPPKSKPAPEA